VGSTIFNLFVTMPSKTLSLNKENRIQFFENYIWRTSAKQ